MNKLWCAHTLGCCAAVQKNEKPEGRAWHRRWKPGTELWSPRTFAAGCCPPHNPRSEPLENFKFRFQMTNFGKPRRDDGREGTKVDCWPWRCVSLECSKYKRVKGRGRRAGLATSDTGGGSGLWRPDPSRGRRRSSQCRGCQAPGGTKPPSPAQLSYRPPVASRAKSGLLGLAGGVEFGITQVWVQT